MAELLPVALAPFAEPAEDAAAVSPVAPDADLMDEPELAQLPALTCDAAAEL
jgi:hypothetical protein